jgi:uncharacterized membrane protein YuzA (DUF378 family)
MIKIGYIIVGIIAAYYSINTGIDIFCAFQNPDDYKRIYHIGQPEHWQFRTHSNYLIWRGFQLALYLWLSFFAFRKLKETEKSIWDKVFYGIVIICVVWLLRYYFLWYQSGYDHYPGCDPYVF